MTGPLFLDKETTQNRLNISKNGENSAKVRKSQEADV